MLWRGSADEDEEVEEEDDDEMADAEDEAEDNAGGWLSLGGLMHTVLSFRTRLALMLPRPRASGGGSAQ